MSFGDKIKALRKQAGLSQQELADKLGVTQKSICNYENNSRFPKGQAVIKGISELFGVSVDYLLENDTPLENTSSSKEQFIDSAKQTFGYKGKKEAEVLLEKTAAMMAGGELSEEDKDAFFQSITEIYFDAKHKARKKYGKKKNDKSNE